MAHQIDLGRCLFHAMGSPIQLQCTATGCLNPQLSQLEAMSAVKDRDISQWLGDVDVWVKEAPEIEIRFVISESPGLETLVTAFVSGLGEQLCSSRAWADFGFTISFKSCNSVKNDDHPGNYCLTFGLCRGHGKSSLISGRALPLAMRDPPDAQPPLDMPTVSLAAIDVCLEYGLSETTSRHGEYKGDSLLHSFDYMPRSYTAGVQGESAANAFLNDNETTTFLMDHRGPVDCTPGQEDDSKSLQAMFLLLELGLRHLTISSKSKIAGIKIVGDERLKCLSKVAPVVFSLGYHGAMKQRAVSIPIITRALTSMLEGNPNPVLQRKLSSLLQGHSQGTNSFPSTDSIYQDLKPTMQSALWRIAQRQLQTSKHKTPISFFPPTSPPESLTGGQDTARQNSTNNDPPINEEDYDLDSYLGSEYNYNTAASQPQQEIPDDEVMEEGDAMLCSSSESSFIDISESTQTTLDVPSQLTDVLLPYMSDTEMLFADCDLTGW